MSACFCCGCDHPDAELDRLRDRGEAYLHVNDVDRVHEAWAAAGLPVSPVRDEPWGMREFNVVDPGGNRVRVGRSI